MRAPPWVGETGRIPPPRTYGTESAPLMSRDGSAAEVCSASRAAVMNTGEHASWSPNRPGKTAPAARAAATGSAGGSGLGTGQTVMHLGQEREISSRWRER